MPFVFVYVIVYNYVNVCTRHNNKPFTYLLIYNLHVNIYNENIIHETSEPEVFLFTRVVQRRVSVV